MNFVFCEWVLYFIPTCYETVHCTVSPKFTREFGATCLLCFAQFTPLSKRRKAPKTARTLSPCRLSNPSECNKLHPPPFAREANRFIYFIWRGSAALSVSYLIIVPMVLGAIPAAFASSVSMCIARA